MGKTWKDISVDKSKSHRNDSKKVKQSKEKKFAKQRYGSAEEE